MQPKGCQKLDVPSLMMMTPHLTFIPAVHTGSPAIINDNDDAPPMVRRPWTQAELRT
jgi:hypothetical protein